MKVISFLLAFSHRIRTLALPAMTDFSFAAVRGTIFNESDKLPLLEELELSIANSIGTTYRLSCFLIDFTPAAYKHLTCLDLPGCSVSANVCSYEQLIDMLPGCEALEELQLKQSISTIVIFDLRVPLEREHRVTRLSKMRKLVIWDKTPIVARSLSYIDLPIESTVRIVGTYDSRTDIRTASDAFVSLLPKDRRGFPILRAVTRADLVFYQTDAKLRAWRGDTKVTLKLRTSPKVRNWEFYLNRGLR